jgi:hypothetical protein
LVGEAKQLMMCKKWKTNTPQKTAHSTCPTSKYNTH